MKQYKIGRIAELSGLTLRTIRYYDEMGLLAAKRTQGGQRYFSDQDLVYLKRIMELKGLGFSLEEIAKIIRLKDEDSSGNKRRTELLAQYRMKMQEAEARLKTLQDHIDELQWHISQLEAAEDGFKACPGAACAGCEFRDRCTFFKEQ